MRFFVVFTFEFSRIRLFLGRINRRMKHIWRDGKYLIAYLLPLAAFGAVFGFGWQPWSVLILGFVIIPTLELLLPFSTYNFPETEEQSRSGRMFFDFLLYLNVPLLYSILFLFLHRVTTVELLWHEQLGMIFSVGICLGVMGINVAHELGHRKKPFERVLAKMLLLPNNYMHFIIEHNRGHHKNVSTPLDPASARLNEIIYFFYFRTIIMSYISAWKLEKMRLERSGESVWSWKNEMIRFALFQLLFALGVFFIFGGKGLLAYFAVSLMGVLLLETVNYVEHYGLRRKEVAPGVYEKVKPVHSWNSDHEVGRIFLYELTRHSDHHYKDQRKYQVLRHFDESPQLPTGYPGCMLMSLIPPLWFAVMNKRVQGINQAEDALNSMPEVG